MSYEKPKSSMSSIFVQTWLAPMFASSVAAPPSPKR
jgi:hypothetical protein